MNITEKAAAVLREIDAALEMAEKATLTRYQLCGCVVCICEDDERCHGCGAANCGTHPVGQIPQPVYKVTAICRSMRCLKTAIKGLLKARALAWPSSPAAIDSIGESITTLCETWEASR